MAVPPQRARDILNITRSVKIDCDKAIYKHDKFHKAGGYQSLDS